MPNHLLPVDEILNGIAATAINLSLRVFGFFIGSAVILRGWSASVQADAEVCVSATDGRIPSWAHENGDRFHL
jgi:hypothetical protein